MMILYLGQLFSLVRCQAVLPLVGLLLGKQFDLPFKFRKFMRGLIVLSVPLPFCDSY
jgi:hypothetical protein